MSYLILFFAILHSVQNDTWNYFLTFAPINKRTMIINNEIKFAEKVILIDATYINKVTADLSHHFGSMIGRELPKADLPIFLECVAMDAAIQPGDNVLQVLFVYDKTQPRMDAFVPGDLKKELNDDLCDLLRHSNLLHILFMHCGHNLFISHIAPPSIMSLLFADVHIYHRNDEYDRKKNECGSRSTAFLISEGVIDIADHGVQRLTADSLHIVAEDTDDARIFLESADKAGDNNVGDHRGKERNGDLGEHAQTGSGIDLRGVIILLVYTLQTAEKDEYFEGERIPYDIDNENGNVLPISRSSVDPVDGISTENAEDVVYDTE